MRYSVSTLIIVVTMVCLCFGYWRINIRLLEVEEGKIKKEIEELWDSLPPRPTAISPLYILEGRKTEAEDKQLQLWRSSQIPNFLKKRDQLCMELFDVRLKLKKWKEPFE